MSEDTITTDCCLPDRDQRELLTAVLNLDDEQAVAAWRKWQAHNDLDRIDLGSQRLVPLLHDRLSRLSVRHAEEDRYRAVHRYWWLRNSMQLARLAEALNALDEAGLDRHLVMGGMALVGDIYPSRALRPTFDSDLLIPPDHVRAVIGVLAHLGFAPTSGSARALEAPWLESLARRQTGIRIGDAQQTRISLWWTPMGGWERAVPAQSNELPSRALAPVDQLLATCSQPLYRRDFLPLWWVVDATLMLRKYTFGPNQLVALAHERRLALPVATMLSYLADEFGAPVAPGVISQLRAAPHRRHVHIDPLGARRWRRAYGLVSQYLQHRRVSAEGSFVEFVRVTKDRPNPEVGVGK